MVNLRIGLGLGLVLALLVASADVDAQLGGLLKKKAGEIVGGKKAPAPTTPTTGANTAAPPATTPAPAPAPAPAPGDSRGATATQDRKTVSPLEIGELDLRKKATAVLRDDIGLEESGAWTRLPYISKIAVAAARALGESAQVALVETVGGALKTLVMSDAFAAEHDSYIKSEHKAVNHGLTGLVPIEELLKRGDEKAFLARLARVGIVAIVDSLRDLPADSVTTMFDGSMNDWTRYAEQPARRDRAKYQKLVSQGQALRPLAATDLEKFRRGYAALRVAEEDGPVTEEAVFADYTRAKQEEEQLAWDRYNLKGQLKRQLATFMAVAATVDFAAATEEKDGETRFVNPAYERKDAIWKACFRAGKGPTTAALQLARAWAKEL